MPNAAASRDWVDYLVSLTPICVALFAALIGWRQSSFTKEKLRLDLYNKRFDVYEKTLFFYQAITMYDGSRSEDFQAQLRDFSKAMKESQFLFDEGSGIYATLSRLHADSFKVIGFKEGAGKEVFDSGDHVAFSKMHTDMQDVLTSFAFRIDSIEKAIAPYLNFHKIA